MFSVTHFYNRPVHAIRIFERVLREQGALGRSLHALTHVCSLGIGIRLRFAFAESAPMVDHRLVYRLGTNDYRGERRLQLVVEHMLAP